MASGRPDYTDGYIKEQSIVGREKSIFYEGGVKDWGAGLGGILYQYQVDPGYDLWVGRVDITTDSPSPYVAEVYFTPHAEVYWITSGHFIYDLGEMGMLRVEEEEFFYLYVINMDRDVSVKFRSVVIGFLEKL